MIIKFPPCYDTSHWETIPDFALVSPPPLLVITKATEGLTYKDDTFDRYMADLLQDGINRGAFHFFRKAYDATQQARFFCDTVRPHINNRDVLVLDVEEGGETATQLHAWCMEVIRQYPDNLLMIYSRKNILDAITMTSAQKAFFKLIPIWTAGYPLNPDAYTTVPASYIPDQTRWGEVWLWQYSDRGVVNGIAEMVDCNWMSPKIVNWLGASIPPSAETVTTPFTGVTKYKGMVNNVNYYLYKIDLSKGWQARVRHFAGNLGYASSAAKADGAQLVVNGDDYLLDGVYTPSSMAYTDGVAYQGVQVDWRPFLDIQSNNKMTIGHNKPAAPYNLTSFVHYLIRNGVAEPWLYDMTKIESSEIHAISAKGYDAAGNLLLLVIEGKVDPLTGIAYKGARLHHAAEILLQHGATWAGQSGGGGDAGVFENGIMINEPSDPTERGVVQVLELFNGGTMPTTRYEATAIGKDTRLRPDHDTNNTAIGSYPAGTVFYGDVIWTAPANLYNATGIQYQKIGDVWLQTVSPKIGWVAVTNMGGAITTLKDNGTPPPADSITIDIVVHDVKVTGDEYTGTGLKLNKTK